MIPWPCIENFYRYVDHIIWLVVWNMFPHILEIIIPTDFHIFQRGGSTANHIYIYICIYILYTCLNQHLFKGLSKYTIAIHHWAHHHFKASFVQLQVFYMFLLTSTIWEYHPELASYCNLYCIQILEGRCRLILSGVTPKVGPYKAIFIFKDMVFLCFSMKVDDFPVPCLSCWFCIFMGF